MNTTNKPEEFAGANPMGRDLQVELSMPEKFEIKMVNASALNDYEIWSFISSFMLNFLVGFGIAAITYNKETYAGNVVPSSQFAQNLLWIITVIFLFFSIASICYTLRKRHSMKNNIKTFKYIANALSEPRMEETE